MNEHTPGRLVPRRPSVNVFDLEACRAAPGYWYLATPYTKYHEGIEAAFVAASIATAGLIRLGIAVFSPIAHTHPVGIHGGIDPLDVDFWLKADEPLMEKAHGLIVFKMTGWDDSKGVRHEIEKFATDGKPTEYLSPEQLKNALLIQQRKARQV